MSSRASFENRVVWITGASSGIGRALAHAFGAAGARLLLSGRDRARLEAVRQECLRPAEVRVLPFDIAALDDLPRLAQEAERAWGQVDVMVHNAGVALRARVQDAPMALDAQVMATNYFGAVALTKALLPAMLARGAGHFVVVSSLSGRYGIPQLSAYAASKHALYGFFESLRAEAHAQGIRVTLVVPGIVRTPILERALTASGAAYAKFPEEYRKGMDPEVCAAKILRAAARGREEVLVGGSELATVYLKRFFPTLLSRLIRSHPLRLRRRLARLFAPSKQ